ncbi:ABC transporter ATP-binding protein [Caenimonas terrae]|uniref:ABC transporter ATP-binding protein n=1 Tax=Caenimonas terrae TaxID=696074 RepID=A0ABW0NK15_9BURK
MTAPAVLATGLCLQAAGRPIVDAVSFSVAAGEIFGIVGADGAGKSALLRLLTGQQRPSAGTLALFGRPAGDPQVRERLAYMPQVFGQYPDLSVRENLRFYAALHGLRGAAASAMVADLTARAGLRGFEQRRAGQLSGGMMQKLALACALVTRPRAIFLDEPTTGVDPVSRRAFWQLLEGVRAEGVAIVCATANMEEAERCDRIAMMRRGRFRHIGTALELIASVRSHLYLAAGAQGRALVPLLRARPEVELAFPVGRQARVWLPAGAAIAALQAAIPDVQFTPLAPGLHDVALRDLALQQEGGDA